MSDRKWIIKDKNGDEVGRIERDENPGCLETILGVFALPLAIPLIILIIVVIGLIIAFIKFIGIIAVSPITYIVMSVIATFNFFLFKKQISVLKTLIIETIVVDIIFTIYLLLSSRDVSMCLAASFIGVVCFFLFFSICSLISILCLKIYSKIKDQDLCLRYK